MKIRIFFISSWVLLPAALSAQQLNTAPSFGEPGIGLLLMLGLAVLAVLGASLFLAFKVKEITQAGNKKEQQGGMQKNIRNFDSRQLEAALN